MRKMALLAALGLSMASAPVMAQTTAQPVITDRAGPQLDETNAQAHHFPWLIIFVIVAVGAGLYFAFNKNDNHPTSP